MKLKYLLAITLAFTLITNTGKAKDQTAAPHPWVQEIATEITQNGQDEACAKWCALNKKNKNCGTYDGAAIAKIVCTTHDHQHREAFEKGQCGVKAAQTFGAVNDVGEYFEKAIDLGMPDAIALACQPPKAQLRGKLLQVALKKCG